MQLRVCVSKPMGLPGWLLHGKHGRKDGNHQKDGGEMLVAIGLDKTVGRCKRASRGSYQAYCKEFMQILQDKEAHPVLAQMVNPDVR